MGTIANVRGCFFENIKNLKPNSERPAEQFFMLIKKGDKPETNKFSKLAVEWIGEWLKNMRFAFGNKVKPNAQT